MTSFQDRAVVPRQDVALNNRVLLKASFQARSIGVTVAPGVRQRQIPLQADRPVTLFPLAGLHLNNVLRSG